MRVAGLVIFEAAYGADRPKKLGGPQRAQQGGVPTTSFQACNRKIPTRTVC
jgi:hypothetical protein